MKFCISQKQGLTLFWQKYNHHLKWSNCWSCFCIFPPFMSLASVNRACRSICLTCHFWDQIFLPESARGKVNQYLFGRISVPTKVKYVWPNNRWIWHQKNKSFFFPVLKSQSVAAILHKIVYQLRITICCVIFLYDVILLFLFTVILNMQQVTGEVDGSKNIFFPPQTLH